MIPAADCDAGRDQRRGFGPVARNGVVGVGRAGVDDGQRDAGWLQVVGDGTAEAAEAAHDPLPARRPVRFGDRRFRQAGEQFDQPEALRGGDGQREVFGEALERVDDMIGAERGHVGGHRIAARTGDHRHLRVEQADGDGDGEVDLLVVGHRQNTTAFRVGQTGPQEVVRQPGIGSQCRGIGLEIVQIEFLDAQFVLFENDESAAGAVEGAADQVAGFACAADDVERFLEAQDAAGEAVGGQGVLEALVLQQRDQA